jgi:hypothetical protein
MDTTQMADDPSDFLARERALLGDDADQFATPADNAATVDDDDDLLGGGHSHQASADHEMGGFESSFPAIDTSNEVSFHYSSVYHKSTPTNAYHKYRD